MNGTAGEPHSALEDLLALVTGTLVVAVGLEFFHRTGVGTGGAPGLAFLVVYAGGLPLWAALILVNLPFYGFALWRMGWIFTAKTVAAVSLLAAETWMLPRLVEIGRVEPLFGAAFGGLMVGVGLLILIRHKSSLGGVGIVAVFLQEKKGWSAGKVQMALDAAILSGTLFVLDLAHVGLSLIGAATLNLVLATNHRRGRYLGY
ncbi:MAG: YitT family protein [Hyphomicrobiales bacterium]|nr:YitT family protein [Hyphomicrobiales bacterium]